jgi:hypothetical protein
MLREGSEGSPTVVAQVKALGILIVLGWVYIALQCVIAIRYLIRKIGGIPE